MLGQGYPQKATYWGPPTLDGLGGESFGTHSLIRVRWEEREEEFLSVEGAQLKSRAIIFTRDILELGGYLALADYSTTPAPLDPSSLVGTWEIQKTLKVPDIRNAVNERRIYL